MLIVQFKGLPVGLIVSVKTVVSLVEKNNEENEGRGDVAKEIAGRLEQSHSPISI